MSKKLSKATIKRHIKSNGGVYKRTVDEVIEVIQRDIGAGKGDWAYMCLWFLGFSRTDATEAVNALWAEQGSTPVGGE